ncbi:phospholipase D family protein [Belliella pelovolcani]|uniref:PLD-like domain-containing protein n=1 Tax=Belliella pelovolcani TaxID=529505 RepID=A0A1N7KV92_9BACT|nr:phospholipase D family protein [Belliella pelovolcani]SIS65461.1 PLD-like domain-containing protein [Belliella pelovolcani]
MAEFLNTALINQWIPRLINESTNELVIIVPYIKTSENTFNQLLEADTRGIEITIIYRENELSQLEKIKLSQLKNLNLLCHPNIHAKLYMNERNLIICSMNLYEYSERNNREMGVLFNRCYGHSALKNRLNDSKPVKDAIDEIRQIVNASTLDRKSCSTEKFGLNLEILKSTRELAEEEYSYLKEIFNHKKFEFYEENEKLIPIFKNYFDRVDLILGDRASLKLNFDEERKSKIYEKFIPLIEENIIPGFKFYWNNHKSDLMLYRNSKMDTSWDTLSKDDCIIKMKSGVDEIIKLLKPHLY